MRRHVRRVSVLIRSKKNKREDAIEVEIPPHALWDDIHGAISAATIESVPAALKQVDEKIAEARHKLSNRTKGAYGVASGQSGDAQARYSLEWIDHILIPYLAKLRR